MADYGVDDNLVNSYVSVCGFVINASYTALSPGRIVTLSGALAGGDVHDFALISSNGADYYISANPYTYSTPLAPLGAKEIFEVTQSSEARLQVLGITKNTDVITCPQELKLSKLIKMPYAAVDEYDAPEYPTLSGTNTMLTSSSLSLSFYLPIVGENYTISGMNYTDLSFLDEDGAVVSVVDYNLENFYNNFTHLYVYVFVDDGSSGPVSAKPTVSDANGTWYIFNSTGYPIKALTGSRESVTINGNSYNFKKYTLKIDTKYIKNNLRYSYFWLAIGPPESSLSKLIDSTVTSVTRKYIWQA